MKAEAQSARPVCDYEGSAYRTEFWGQGRDYEDAVERTALRHFLPIVGRRLIDIGAGYGRLVPLYRGYDEVVLFDYALSQLEQARDLWGEAGPGGTPRYVYVAGNFYEFPLSRGLFDTVSMVRTLHHAIDAPAVLNGIHDILAPGGTLVMEFANKRNLKAILRYLIGRQGWSPFDRDPVEFARLNFDFHPEWMRERLSEVGLEVCQQRGASFLRMPILKRAVPIRMLVAMDRFLQPRAASKGLSPSIFFRCTARADKPSAMEGCFFRCIVCGSTSMSRSNESLSCRGCGARFAVRNGIYDLRAPLRRGGG